MSKIRTKHSKEVKFKAAMALAKGEKTLIELCEEYAVHQSVLHRWKKTLLEDGPNLYEDQRSKKKDKEKIDSSANFERKIGQMAMELDFLKKALGQ